MCGYLLHGWKIKNDSPKYDCDDHVRRVRQECGNPRFPMGTKVLTVVTARLTNVILYAHCRNYLYTFVV